MLPTFTMLDYTVSTTSSPIRCSKVLPKTAIETPIGETPPETPIETPKDTMTYYPPVKFVRFADSRELLVEHFEGWEPTINLVSNLNGEERWCAELTLNVAPEIATLFDLQGLQHEGKQREFRTSIMNLEDELSFYKMLVEDKERDLGVSRLSWSIVSACLLATTILGVTGVLQF